MWSARSTRDARSGIASAINALSRFEFRAPSARSLATLTIRLRAEILDLYADTIGWLVDIGEKYPDGYRLDQNHTDEPIYLVCVDPCRHCAEPDRLASWPTTRPEFCSTECALGWLNEHANEIEDFDDLDETIREACEKAALDSEQSVKEEQREQRESDLAGILESDDNPLLELVRLHTVGYVSLDDAVKRLGRALRSGAIRL